MNRRSIIGAEIVLLSLFGHFSLAGGEAQPAEPVLLRYKFTPEQQLRYRMQTLLTIELGADKNRKTVMETEQKSVSRFTVTDVAADGSGTLEMVVERLRIRMSAPGNEDLTFDSSKPGALGNCPSNLLPLAVLVGKPLTFRQLPMGEVNKITGMDAIYKEALKNARPDQKEAIEAAMKQAQGSSAGVFGLEILLANTPVQVGQRWSSRKGPFPFFCGQRAYECDYVLEELSKDTASVKFSSRHSVTKSLAPLEAELLRQTRIGGHFVHDIRRGVLLTMEAASRGATQAGGTSLQTKTEWQVSLLDNESAAD